MAATAARLPRILASNKGKVIDRRDPHPYEEGYGRQNDMSQKVAGSNPNESKGFICMKSLSKFACICMLRG